MRSWSQFPNLEQDYREFDSLFSEISSVVPLEIFRLPSKVSLILAPLEFDPASRVIPVGTAMGEVNDSALFIPDILTADGQLAPHPQPVDAWSHIDIVSDEKCLPGGEFDDEPLVAIPFVVVWKDRDHRSGKTHLDLRLFHLESTFQNAVGSRNPRRRRVVQKETEKG